VKEAEGAIREALKTNPDDFEAISTWALFFTNAATLMKQKAT
jgi:hypothetical protein